MNPHNLCKTFTKVRLFKPGLVPPEGNFSNSVVVRTTPREFSKPVVVSGMGQAGGEVEAPCLNPKLHCTLQVPLARLGVRVCVVDDDALSGIQGSLALDDTLLPGAQAVPVDNVVNRHVGPGKAALP